MDKVLFDISAKKNTLYRSGEEFLNNYFNNSYFQLTFLSSSYSINSYNNTGFKEEIIYKKIKWRFLNLNSIFSIIQLSYRINRASNVHVLLHGFTAPLHVLGLRLLLKRGVKIIVQHHAEKPFENSIKRFVQTLAYKHLSGYLFSAKALANQYIDKGVIKHNAKIFEIMEGSTLFQTKDKVRSKQKLNLSGEELFIWVGRLDTNKDPLTLLHAFKMYKENGGEFKLFMIYNSNELENKVKDFIIEQALSESIFLIGRLAHHEMEDWYNAADYFVSASNYEGSGYALCEAMACGCIPIVTTIPSFEKMTNNGNCGLLFEPGNSESLFNKLSTLNTLNKDAIKQKVLEQFRNELSFEAISLKYESVFRKMDQGAN